MIIIDEARCIGCGRCVADCFPGNLRLVDGKAQALGACIECGHCFAVCPADAVEMPEGYDTKDVTEFADWPPEFDADALLAALKSRRSIRRFADEALSEAALAQVIEAGRYTPTGSNAQNVRYVVVQNTLTAFKEKLWAGFDAAMDAARAKYGADSRVVASLQHLWDAHTANAADDRLFFNAPALLIVVSPAPLNGGLAASSMALMAHVCGLGTLYSGFIQTALASNATLCAELGIAPQQINACLLIGKPAVQFERTAPRKPAAIDWR